MSQHNDMLHPQMTDGKLEGGADAVLAAVFLVGGHQIGHVTDREDVPRRAVGQDGGVNSRVGTADDHGLGALSLLE